METATLGIKVDASDAIETLNTLTDAVDRVSKALDELAGKSHGGIEVRVVGAVAHVEIKPVQ